MDLADPQEALRSWVARVELCGANLGDLQATRDFARLKAKAAQNRLGAATRTVADRAMGDMAALWSLWQALKAVVESAAAEGRKGGFLRSPDAEVLRLLSEPTVEAGVVKVDAKVRSPFEAAERRVMLTPEQAAARIEELVRRVQDDVRRAREGWDRQAEGARALAEEAQALLTRAATLGNEEVAAAAQAAVAAAASAALSGEDDPIGTLNALDAVRAALDAARFRLDAAEAALREAQAGLRAARTAFEALATARAADAVVHTRAAERIDAASGLCSLPAADELDNLGRWLGRLESRPHGRFRATQVGLRSWTAVFEAFRARERQAVETLEALLHRRKDLREQFAMLDATAADIARRQPLPPAVAAARDAAGRALRRKPMSIADARAAVARFEGVVLGDEAGGAPARGKDR